MQEYALIMKERNQISDEDGVEGIDYEWIELPSFDDPTKKIKMKRFHDIEGKVKE